MSLKVMIIHDNTNRNKMQYFQFLIKRTARNRPAGKRGRRMHEKSTPHGCRKSSHDRRVSILGPPATTVMPRFQSSHARANKSPVRSGRQAHVRTAAGVIAPDQRGCRCSLLPQQPLVSLVNGTGFRTRASAIRLPSAASHPRAEGRPVDGAVTAPEDQLPRRATPPLRPGSASRCRRPAASRSRPPRCPGCSPRRVPRSRARTGARSAASRPRGRPCPRRCRRS